MSHTNLNKYNFHLEADICRRHEGDKRINHMDIRDRPPIKGQLEPSFRSRVYLSSSNVTEESVGAKEGESRRE